MCLAESHSVLGESATEPDIGLSVVRSRGWRDTLGIDDKIDCLDTENVWYNAHRHFFEENVCHSEFLSLRRSS